MKRYSKASRLLLYTLGLSGMMSFPAMAQTDIHVLDVGQGLSVLIESDHHAMLFDGGDRGASSQVISYLKQQGITKLDYAVASHYDSDHLNGIVGALNAFPVENVWGPDYTTNTKIYSSFRSAADKTNYTHPSVGERYQLGDAEIQVLAPSGSGYDDVNNYSIVLRIKDGDTSFLITGDAEAESESEMVAKNRMDPPVIELDSDVYVLGHHGSGTSTSWDLLQDSVPEYAILSCGTGNSYGHPHVETMEKLEVMEIPLFRTDMQGTIVASTDGKTITWNTEPCNDYTPGDPDDIPPQPQETEPAGPADDIRSANDTLSTTAEYILNVNSHMIHYPDCRSAKAMSEKNKLATSESRDALIAQGYTPCKTCKP